MSVKKRLLSVLLCIALLFGALFGCTIGVSAAEYSFSLTINQVTALPGDTVAFYVEIADNPGIMAVTITFHYDSSVLEFDKFYNGVIAQDTLKDNGDYVSIVNCYSKNQTKNGVFFGMQFKVKENAPAGFHAVTIRNIRPDRYGDSLAGCFANRERDKLIPQLTPGGITVGYTGTNCNHRFTEWDTTIPPTCTAPGVATHSCNVCGHTETNELPAAGHSYDENWTIDRAADALRDGSMSRHCLNCDAQTDKVSFTVRDAEGNGFPNTVGTVIPPESWKPLQDIVDSNMQQSAAPEETAVPETSPSPDPITQPEIDDDFPESADDLVAAVQNIGLFERIYRYLFGADDNSGIIHVIRSGISDAVRQVLRYMRLLATGILFLWLL